MTVGSIDEKQKPRALRYSQPQVSIGMPVYNGEQFIRDALDSILAQTFTDFELIVSDNASDDETESICKEYVARDPRVLYIRHSTNCGPTTNYRFVLESARGKYFMWAAHDDLLFPRSFLELLVTRMSEGYDYVFPNVTILNQINQNSQANVMAIFGGIEGKYHFAKASVKLNSYQLYSLFRRDILNKYFRFLEECKNMKCFNEGLFVHAISTDLRGSYVPSATKIYRRHLNNLSSSVPAIKLLAEFLRYYGKTILFFFKAPSLTIFERALVLSNVLLGHSIYCVHLIINCFKNSVTRRHD